MQNIVGLTFATSCLATWNGHAEVISCEQGKNNFHLLRFRLVEFCSTGSGDLGIVESKSSLGLEFLLLSSMLAYQSAWNSFTAASFAYLFFLFIVWLLLHPPVIGLMLPVGLLQFKWEKRFQQCSKLCLKLRRRRILRL